MELVDSLKVSIRQALLKPNLPDLSKLEATYKAETEMDPEVKKLFLDQSFRSYLTEVLLAVPDKVNLDDCKAIITLAIKAARDDLCPPAVPVGLLSDVFDVITLNKCEELFGFVEMNVDIWKETLFFQAIKNNLLRICNDLLRRLSRSLNTVFCGRILLFLAKFFPFSERSGLNVVSEFNLENLTVFSTDVDEINKAAVDGDEEMEVDEDGAASEPKKIKIDADLKSLHIDYALYCKFWQLQDFFRNPVQCYNKENWAKFSTYSLDVLKTFKSFKIDAVSGKKLRDASGAQDDDQFFAKYLTNQNLLQLQLSDSNFRRYFYIQMLILFQYLQSSVKFKQDSHVLTDEQTKWINSSREKIFQLIKETPPHGDEFAASVQYLLRREEQWNSWKNDGCPALVAAAAATAAKNGGDQAVSSLAVTGGTRKRKRKLGDTIRDATVNGRFLMGNAALSKLWNICPDNLEACASSERDFLPSVDEYFGEAVDQLDPANQVEDAYKKVNDGQWGWRALRLLAKKSPHFFTYGNNPIAKLPDYLESMLKKMAASGNLNRPSSSSVNADSSLETSRDASKTIKSEPNDDTEGTQAEDTAFVCKPEHLEKLAANLAKVADWKKLIPKLGFSEEALQKIYDEKKLTAPQDQILAMLNKWSEDEGSGATNDEIIYILVGAKLAIALRDVFPAAADKA